MSRFEEKIRSLAERAAVNSLSRQRECVNLIPSENTPSFLVRALEVTDPAGRYAEHRAIEGKEVYFYEGIEFIRDVEDELQRELKEFVGCPQVEVRPVSGQMANMVVFSALVRHVNQKRPKGTPLRRLRCAMNNELIHGGHLSSQPLGALFNFVEVDPESGKQMVVNFPVRKDNMHRTDVEAAVRLLQERRPELVVFGKSMFLFREPVAEIRKAAAALDPPPLLMYDMAHTFGLYGPFQAPLQEGADVVTASTHKTFFGSQRGIIAANLPKGHPLEGIWAQVVNRAFPGFTSNHHLGTLLGLLAATIEMNAFRGEYQAAVLRNAKAFARALREQGIPVEGEADGFTETHQVLFRVRQWGSGDRIAKRLRDQGIVTNYQALPDDASFTDPSGIRTGVQEMTRFGMKEEDLAQVASLIGDVVVRGKEVRDAVRVFRGRFLEMRYCMPAEQAVPLAARILDSALASPADAKALGQRLAGA